MTFLGRGGGGKVTLLNIHCFFKYTIFNNNTSTTTTTPTTKKLVFWTVYYYYKKIVFWTVFNFYLPKPPPTTRKIQIP